MTAIPEHITCVLDDTDKFKLKAEIGDNAYKWLTTAENMENYIKAVMTGGTVTAATIMAYLASLGPFGHLLALIGLTNLPWALALGLGVGAAGLTFGSSKWIRKWRKSAIKEIPRFLGCPRDLLALAVAKVLLTPCVLLSADVRNASRALENAWGYNRAFLKWLRSEIADPEGGGSLTAIAKMLRAPNAIMGHVPTEKLATSMRELVDDCALISSPTHAQLYDAFLRHVEGDKAVTLETIRLLEQAVLGRDVPMPQSSPRLPWWRRVIRGG